MCLHPEAVDHGRVHSERDIDPRPGMLTDGGASSVERIDATFDWACSFQVTSVTAKRLLERYCDTEL